MRITTTLVMAFLALACGLVQAQAYRWVDKDGKVRYGDSPPPGVKATVMKGVAGPAASPSSTAAAAKDAKGGRQRRRSIRRRRSTSASSKRKKTPQKRKRKV